MRSVFAAMIMLSASTAAVLPAEGQNETPNRPGYGYMQAPVGHRQPTQNDVEGADQVQIEMDKLANQATEDDVVRARQSEENEVAETIDRENQLLDRELRTICRGC